MKAAIMGYGTIGSGVFEVLNRNREIIAKKAGEPIDPVRILDLRDFPGDPAERLIVHEIDEILKDEAIGIVVETMGGTSPAYEFVRNCLLAGKHVVTSNKALVAAHGTELLAIAKKWASAFSLRPVWEAESRLSGLLMKVWPESRSKRFPESSTERRIIF